MHKKRKYAHGGDWGKMGRSDKQFIVVLEQKRPLRSVCQALAPLSEKEGEMRTELGRDRLAFDGEFGILLDLADLSVSEGG